MRDGGTKGKLLLCNGPGGGWQKTVCDPGGQSTYKKSRHQNSSSPEYFFQGERTERSGNFSGVRLVEMAESSLECRKHFLRAGRRMILKIRGSGCSRMRMKKFVGMYHKSSIEGFDLLYERRGQNRAVGASEEYSLPLQLTQGLHSALADAKQVALAHSTYKHEKSEDLLRKSLLPALRFSWNIHWMFCTSYLAGTKFKSLIVQARTAF